MGNQISCCDAKAQLENVSSIGRIVEEHTIQNLPSFTVPPMSKEIHQLINKSKRHRFYKNTPAGNNPNLTSSGASLARTPQALRETLIFGKDNKGAIYTGETLNNTAHGYGSVSFVDGSCFEGSFMNGEPVNGVFVFNHLCYFVGDIENYQASGNGVYENIDNGYLYEGSWKKNLQHGFGIEQYSNGDRYEGNFIVGSKFGEGEYKFSDGKVYKGQFYNGLSDGNGILKLANGNSYEGEWQLGAMHGHGVYKWKNGEKYEGEYQEGVRQGVGKYWFAGGAVYEGGWVGGVQEGEGVVKEGFDEVKGRWVGGEKMD